MTGGGTTEALRPVLLVVSTIAVTLAEVGRTGLYRLTDLGSGLVAGDVDPRRARAWRVLAWCSPALPLIALLRPSSNRGTLALAVVGLGALVVHSAALRTQVWVAAYQPGLIPPWLRPLGARPVRDADRRLHLLLRTHVLHAIPLVVVLAVIGIHHHPVQVALALLFFLRYAGHAATDHEACTHWQMHCDVFALRGRGRLVTPVWTAAMEWLVGPLNGYVPYVYPANHLLLHHSYNSGVRDPHSPFAHRRTSFVDFSHFAVRMAGFTMFGTDILRSERCRGGPRRRAVAGIVAYWSTAALALTGGRLLGVALVLIAIHHSLAMSRDAWTWHGLLRPDRSATPLATTTLWVSTTTAELLTLPVDDMAAAGPDPAVAWAFYDNLHLVHHLHPGAHFTDYPDLLARDLPRIRDRRATVVRWDIFELFPELCWTGDIAMIATHLIDDVDDAREARVARLLSPFGSPDGLSALDAAKGPLLRACDLRIPRALRRLAGPPPTLAPATV